MFQRSTGSWVRLADMKNGGTGLSCGMTINNAGEKVSSSFVDDGHIILKKVTVYS
jgi:hypothetical protein